MASLKYNEYTTKRAVLGTVAKADFGGMQYSGHAETGYDIPVQQLIVTPNVSLNYAYLTENAYTETGGLVNNHVDANDGTSITSELGVKAAYPIKTEGGTVIPKVRTGWIHEFGDTQQSSTTNFVGDAQSYTINSAKLDKDAYHAGTGVSYEMENGTKLSADADYTMRNTSDTVSGFLRLTMPF